MSKDSFGGRVCGTTNNDSAAWGKASLPLRLTSRGKASPSSLSSLAREWEQPDREGRDERL